MHYGASAGRLLGSGILAAGNGMSVQCRYASLSPAWRLMDPGPHPAPRAGLFALHLGQRLTFSCGTDGRAPAY
jgi:hypothetical protein